MESREREQREISMKYEEALRLSQEYFGGAELPAKVWLDKYALRDDNDNLLESTPDDMHRRIAYELSRIEAKKFAKPYSFEEIYSWIKNFGEIIPQGSPMYGIGNRSKYITLSNCYLVKTPSDSYCGIIKSDEELVQISKRRGGVGLDISKLRPTGSLTTNSSRSSTGIIPFMERYSNSTREVGQQSRRGALMITCSIHHPEIMSFITVKNDLTKVTGANISIRLSDEFLEAVKNDTEYELRWPVEKEEWIKEPKRVSRMIRAKDVWDAIVHNAWKMAEPGILFWDNIIRESPADCYSELGFKTMGTNPCSEIPLCEHDSCRLLLLNLMKFVTKPFTDRAKFDWTKFFIFSRRAQRIMDDIVDLELECIDRIIGKIQKDPEDMEIKCRELKLWENIKEKCQQGRRTGTGITALGDALASLGIRYGSDDSIIFTERLYKTLKIGAYAESVSIARELGAFPIWDSQLESENPFLNRIKNDVVVFDGEVEWAHAYNAETNQSYFYGERVYEAMQKVGRRNIALLTTAPAGTVSILANVIDNIYGTSSGIEPAFMLEYKRRKKINPADEGAKVDFVDQNGDFWQEFTVYHPAAEAWMRITHHKTPNLSPWIGCCAEDLDWTQRVKLQSVAGQHCDHALSSTLNLPEDVTEDRVSEIYLTAWESGLKGITVYRKNCRSGVLIENKKEEKPEETIVKTNALKRPQELKAEIHHVTVQGDEYFVIVGMYENEPYEVLAAKNGCISKKAKYGKIVKVKRGHYRLVSDTGEIIESVTDLCEGAEEVTTRLVSTSLRHGADIAFIVHQLEKTKGSLLTFARGLARILKKYIRDGKPVSGEECQQCGGKLIRKDGCVTCEGCAWSKCS